MACFGKLWQGFCFIGERRIRVHTLAMPTTSKLPEVYAFADQQAIATLLAKMGKTLLQNFSCQSLEFVNVMVFVWLWQTD